MTEIIKKELGLTLIPPELRDEFKTQVFEAYFESHWLDLHHMGFLTENFCVYAHSFKQTGDPYLLVDDPKKDDDDFRDIKESNFNELISDIYEVMRYYNMFHAWNDIGEDGIYTLVSPAIIPVKAVW